MDNRFSLAFNIGQSRWDNATPNNEGDYEDIDREERDKQRVAALILIEALRDQLKELKDDGDAA